MNFDLFLEKHRSLLLQASFLRFGEKKEKTAACEKSTEMLVIQIDQWISKMPQSASPAVQLLIMHRGATQEPCNWGTGQGATGEQMERMPIVTNASNKTRFVALLLRKLKWHGHAKATIWKEKPVCSLTGQPLGYGRDATIWWFPLHNRFLLILWTHYRSNLRCDTFVLLHLFQFIL